MVQEAGPSVTLGSEDFICPLRTIRDTFLSPTSSNVAIPKLRALLAWHEKRIESPWQPFKPASASSRAILAKPSFTLPHTSAQYTVDEATRKLALKVSDAMGLDEIGAFLATRSYMEFSTDGEMGEEDMLERIKRWAAEETLAVPHLALEILKRSEQEDELGQLAYDVKMVAMKNTAAYIEGLFRAFSVQAQKEVDTQYERGADDAVFWAAYQLRLQEAYLSLLFGILNQTPHRPASISQGLIRGCVMSSFGTSQATRDIWGDKEEVHAIATRIRDLTVVIAVESIGIQPVVYPEAESIVDDTPADILLQDKGAIASLQAFLTETSSDLAPQDPEPLLDLVDLPQRPMAIICLAWAIALRSLPEERAPQEEEGVIAWQDMARRALRLPSGFFPWMEAILSGPLLGAKSRAQSQLGLVSLQLYQKKVFKDILIGLSEMMQLENVADKSGLYRSWELLFGAGSEKASSEISADYWLGDYPHAHSRAILERSQFPYQPTHLVSLLASLTGTGDAFGTDPSAHVLHFISNLPSITMTAQAAWCVSEGNESGVELVAASRTLVLPGGGVIPQGSSGEVLRQGGSVQVMWTGQSVPGWGLLLEILQVAAGIHPADRTAAPTALHPADSVYLTVRDLGLSHSIAEILAAGLKFIRATLQSSDYIKASVLTQFNTEGHLSSGQALLQLALSAMQMSRVPEMGIGASAVSDAVDVVEALITAPSSNVWPALRASGIFDGSGKKKGSVVGLIHAESIRGQHELTASVLKLVRTLIDNAEHVPESDTIILTSALQLVYSEVWSNFSTWRYQDVSRKYELSSMAVVIFDKVLSHPVTAEGGKPTAAAQVLIDIFITATSPLTYRPLFDALSQPGYLVAKLKTVDRPEGAEAIVRCLTESVGFLQTLLRIAALVGSPANALPKSLFLLPVSTPSGDKIQLVDNLFDLALLPSATTSNILGTFKTLRTYVEVVSGDPHRPSLASMLRSPVKTVEGVLDVVEKTKEWSVKEAGWNLLASIVTTQPGCVSACVGAEGKELGGPLKEAAEEVEAWEGTFREAPHTLAAVLDFIQAVMRSAGADGQIAILRKNPAFWQAIFDISTRIVPAPPSFSLSMHSEDFATRIENYAYCVQAKANATSLLAAELAYATENDDDDEKETKARELVLSLFRNNSALQEAGLMACHTSCAPELHEQQERKVAECGGKLKALKTVALSCEREYGRSYLYDGTVAIPDSQSKQAAVNLALDMLNLNWSMLDADIALTRAFRLLSESIAAWTEGDALAMDGALYGAIVAAEIVAEEYREGDVMLAIQAERLSILAVLLETALDPEQSHSANTELVYQLAGFVHSIMISHSFPPIVSLRHPELPAIHQPVLRILYLLLQSMSATGSTLANVSSREAFVDAGTVLALEAADIVLDSVVRGVQPAFAGILSMVVGVLCEISKVTSTTTAWLDRVQGVNLVGRSLDVLVRSRVVDGQVPLHLSSILLLHLALASNPSSAEKLAVSGILPAYSDNAIVAEAELGRIAPPPSAYNTVHGAWCGMLLVVKALLATLPDTATFTRTDVVPFLRVCSMQMTRAMGWDGDTPLSAPALDEMELVVDVFYGVACALGPKSLDDYAVPALGLLKAVRYAISHPHLLSTLVVPSSEEEKTKLEEEIALLEGDKEIDLLDFKRAPILAARTATLLRISRTILLTLVVLTRGWEVLREAVEPDRAEEYVIQADEEAAGGGTNSDPVGVINDIFVITQNIVEQLPVSTPTLGGKFKTTPSASFGQTVRQVAEQLMEAAALVSFTQLALRHSLMSPEDYGLEDDGRMDLDMGDGNGGMKRKVSFSQGGSKEGMVLRELEGDLLGMLVGEGGVMGVLRGMAERAFGGEEDEDA
ncbi:hypothetical protein IAT38_003517 [Cryptococcus sp. DSM 104549]